MSLRKILTFFNIFFPKITLILFIEVRTSNNYDSEQPSDGLIDYSIGQNEFFSNRGFGEPFSPKKCRVVFLKCDVPHSQVP